MAPFIYRPVKCGGGFTTEGGVMLDGRCAEPSLDELLGDVTMRLLMRRDGVTEYDIRALFCKLKDARAVVLGGIKRGPT
jgi:hypothetical protein